MLAVVVDDHDYGRGPTRSGGDDTSLNLTTTPKKQAQIYRAMGWAEPVWGTTLSLIHGPDGKEICPSATGCDRRDGICRDWAPPPPR